MTARSMAPTVTIVNFISASAVTAVSVTNSTTGESNTYTGSVAANDILEFDGEQKTVKKNGTAVAFSGSFPSLDVGGNLMSVGVTGAVFSAEATIKYKTTYL